MGGAQPLAVTMNDGVAIIIEVDPDKIARRIRTGYCDEKTESLREAISMAKDAKTPTQGAVDRPSRAMLQMFCPNFSPSGSRPTF